MKYTLLTLLVLAALIVAFGAGCEENPAASYKPYVVNTNDSFHFQVKDFKNHDTTTVYYWHMLGSAANIDQSAEFKGGSVSVTIADSALQQVYVTDLKATGSYTTLSGTPGWWRISIVMKGFSGSIDFWALRK